MPELIKVQGQEDELWFAIHAIGDHDVPRRNDGCLSVTLTVNGVEVPFTATVREMARRLNASVDERAAQRMLSLVTLEPLANLAASLQSYEWEIRSKVEATFDVKLPEP